MSELIQLMHELSEDYYGTSWVTGLERNLWLAMKGDPIIPLTATERNLLQGFVTAYGKWPVLMTPAEYQNVYSLNFNSYDPESYYHVYSIQEWENMMMEELL